MVFHPLDVLIHEDWLLLRPVEALVSQELDQAILLNSDPMKATTYQSMGTNPVSQLKPASLSPAQAQKKTASELEGIQLER